MDSQNATITHAEDDGELEVISKFSPVLAQCAEIVNDKDQTEALAKFAKGEMSYAEMRARCG